MTLLAAASPEIEEIKFSIQRDLFWAYEQQPSGGQYIIDKDKGLSCVVFIEAPTAAAADAAAQALGIYFDGVDDGIDCPCCGPRWVPAEASTSSPEIFGFNVAGQFKHADQYLKPAVEAIIKQSAMMPDPLDVLAFLHKRGGVVVPFQRPRLILVEA